MPIARSGDVDIYYEVQGSGPGVPAVLIMGLATDMHGWERVVPALDGRPLVLLDNRGVGRSGKPKGPYTTSLLADDAAAVMEAVGLAQAHVLGTSLGGMIAQELALRHPQRVRSLALIVTMGRPDEKTKQTADEGAQKLSGRPRFDLKALLPALQDGSFALEP